MVAGGEQTEAAAHETREFTTKVHILATGWLATLVSLSLMYMRRLFIKSKCWGYF